VQFQFWGGYREEPSDDGQFSVQLSDHHVGKSSWKSLGISEYLEKGFCD